MKPIPPLRLVLSGGGARGLSYAGCFIELEKRGFLKKVNEIMGVSCGALFGLAYNIGFKPNELIEFVELFDFSLIQNIEPDVAFQVFSTYGIDNGNNLEKLLISMLKNKNFVESITYLELYKKTKFFFRCFASNMYKCQYQEFSYKETPDIRVIDGLLASMSLPGYFIPRNINNVMYSDGGLVNNFPMDLLSENEIQNTLGFTFSEDHNNVESIPTIINFFNQIYTCSYKLKKQKLISLYNEKIIIVRCGDYPIWNFNASKEDRLKLIDTGKKAIEDFFNLKQFSLKPSRRYSVS
jgi:NTE family protein